MGFPPAMKANKVMHGTDIAGFKPAKEDPNSWKEHELDESLVQLLLDRVCLRAVFWPLSQALIFVSGEEESSSVRG